MQRRFGNELVAYSLTLGPGGRIAEKQERVGHRKAVFAYEYDGQGRLTRVFRDGRPEEEYGYDAQGRRVRDWTRQRGRRSLAYDNAGRLRQAGDTQFYYGQDNTLACRSDRQGSLHLDYGRNLGLLGLHDRHGRAVNFRNNQSGQPLEKHSGGEVSETFRWLDLLRLAEYRPWTRDTDWRSTTGTASACPSPPPSLTRRAPGCCTSATTRQAASRPWATNGAS